MDNNVSPSSPLTPFRIVAGLFGLVVIYVLLLPFFARQQESDHPPTTCVSNLKQIGLGFTQYVQDYDNYYPPARHDWGSVALYPYLKTTRIYGCPADGAISDSRPYGMAYNLNVADGRTAGHKGLPAHPLRNASMNSASPGLNN